MDDTLLVSRAMAGDLDSFGQLYDRYFNRVYDFAWRILRDSDEAADVTQGVFMKAMQGLPGLSKAVSFKSWLFTIAHNTALNRAERAGRSVRLPSAVHEEAFGSFDVPDPCRIDNPALVAEDHELASLVWEAASALSPRDYAVLDLHVRQGLDSAEISSVLAVSKGNAYTMVSRMKTAAADVISSYIVARRGNKDCERLQQVLAPFDFPPYTDEVRRAVDAHIKDCETCQRSRKALAAPLEIFGGFAAVPAPFALKGDLWRTLAGSWNVPAAEASMMLGAEHPGGGIYGPAALAGAGAAGIGLGGGGAGGGYDGGLFGAGGGEWDRRRIMLFAGAVFGLLLFAFAVGAVMVMAIGGGDSPSGGGAAGATKTPGPTRTPTVAISITPGVAVQTATPDLTPSITPTPSQTSTPAPVTDTPVPQTPTKTPTPKKTETPTRTPTPGKPTATATRTPTPGKPTATPTKAR